MKAYEVIADCFVKEGCEVHFSLMGDGNMHFTIGLSRFETTRTIYTRHEHSACAMASAYAVKTARVGVASVTFGPGLTQIATALATAVQARIALVVFTGEIPTDLSWHNQRSDQASLVNALGAKYIAIHNTGRLHEHVRNAFYVARTERRPVVLACPHDIQMQDINLGETYVPSTAYLPDVGRMVANPEAVERAVEMIEASSRIVVIGGLGVRYSDAASSCVALADRLDAYLATTLPVRGMFDDVPFSLGIAGGYSSEHAREKLAQCDLVIAVGASLTDFTISGGHLFPNARIISVNTAPQGLKDGRRVADCFVRADAREGISAIASALQRRGASEGRWKREEVPQFNETPYADELVDAGELLHPSRAIEALNKAIPKDWEIVNGTGHSAYFAAQMRRRSSERFLAIREFGAIGNGLCHAIGVAAADPRRPVVMIDGDGSFFMHVQELDTIRRHDLKMLICILNDGAFGPEIHKLRAQGLDEGGSIYGRGDLGKLAEGFGLKGAVVTSEGQFEKLVKEFEESDKSYVLDIHISDKVIAPNMKRSLRYAP